MIKVGIIGATGYAGAELVRILLNHKDVHISWYGSVSYAGEKFASIYKNFFTFVDEKCINDDLEKLAEDVDVIFTATPSGYTAKLMSESILNKCKIIDLSADFRLKDPNIYEEWYNIKHLATDFLDEAVYGLCEINRDIIKNARLIANPGCYTTCSILSLYPLVKEGVITTSNIVIDAKSGVTGAGRKATLANMFCETNENIKAYGLANHRHTPEIEEQLGLACGHDITINFTPHLIPMKRGILITAYGKLAKDDVSEDKIRNIYAKYYGNEKFIRLLSKDEYPETKWVSGSNYLDIGFKIDKRTGSVIVMGAIDNLVKGAAGQAVQNMNILFGFEEDYGLNLIPMFP